MSKKLWLIDVQKCLFFPSGNVDTHDTSFKQQPRGGYIFIFPSIIAPLHMGVLDSKVQSGTLTTVGLWRSAWKQYIPLNHMGPHMKENKKERLVSIFIPQHEKG